jgi:hypothetical protein
MRKSEGVLGTAVTASFGTIRAAPSAGTTDRSPSRHLLLLFILPLVALGVAAVSPTVLQMTTPTRALIAHRGGLALAGLAGLLGALVGMLIVVVFS